MGALDKYILGETKALSTRLLKAKTIKQPVKKMSDKEVRKEAELNSIYNSSFNDELNKIAGTGGTIPPIKKVEFKGTVDTSRKNLSNSVDKQRTLRDRKSVSRRGGSMLNRL